MPNILSNIGWVRLGETALTDWGDYEMVRRCQEKNDRRLAYADRSRPRMTAHSANGMVRIGPWSQVNASDKATCPEVGNVFTRRASTEITIRHSVFFA